MSENVLDDLEEGEIADDDVIIIEEVVNQKPKRLPRRYDLNEGRVISKHKKNCRHASHKQNKRTERSRKWKFHGKPHKIFPRHEGVRHSNFEVKSAPFNEFITFGLNNKKHKCKSPKMSISKCAFKNYRSPPRKVSKSEHLSTTSPCSVKNIDSFPNLLSDYKKSLSEITDSGSNSNVKEDKKPFSNLSNENDSSSNFSQTPSLSEMPKNDSDDEDEEELRRLALATCLKRQTIQEPKENINSCKASNVSNVPTETLDNYEIVDMEVGTSDAENAEVENSLYVIDTTPSCSSDGNQPSAIAFNSFNINNFDSNNGLQNIKSSVQSFTSDTFSPGLNNPLYSNFETNKSSPLPSQLDEDFEEELLRAELLASMNSVRKQSPSNFTEEKVKKVVPLNEETKFLKHDAKNENRIVSMKSNFRSVNKKFFKKNNFSGKRFINKKTSYNAADFKRIINIENNAALKDERTVSIVNDNKRCVTAVYGKSEFANANLAAKKNVDLKVKVNNVPSQSNTILPSITLPQERIVISLNNESSSDDSGEEDNRLNNLSEEIPAVASLEALIANARHESDGKLDATKTSPDAVSWLSKAQQEEYNSLKQILNSKKLRTQKKVLNNGGNNNLNLLKKKLLIAQRNLDKEKSQINFTTKEMMRKKRAYMISKLKIHQLKEQLNAAEKVRVSNLQMWTKCASNLQTLKKSVSKREAMIESLQSKISSFSPELPSSSSVSSSHTVDHNYNISL